MSEEDSRKLFLEAMEERMVPMVEWVVLELERTMLTAEQLSRKRQKDFGEDYFKSGKGADVSFFVVTQYFSYKGKISCSFHNFREILGLELMQTS